MDGTVLFGIGDFKNVYKQMKANPKVEICAFVAGEWLRVAAEAEYDARLEAQESMLEAYPSLKRMYAVGDGNTAVYYLKNAKATFSSFSSQPETVEF